VWVLCIRKGAGNILVFVNVYYTFIETMHENSRQNFSRN